MLKAKPHARPISRVSLGMFLVFGDTATLVTTVKDEFTSWLESEHDAYNEIHTNIPCWLCWFLNHPPQVSILPHGAHCACLYFTEILPYFVQDMW